MLRKLSETEVLNILGGVNAGPNVPEKPGLDSCTQAALDFAGMIGSGLAVVASATTAVFNPEPVSKVIAAGIAIGGVTGTLSKAGDMVRHASECRKEHSIKAPMEKSHK
jgi:hypothetical protein